MSLINKMLKELDRRHADQPESVGEDGATILTQSLQPVRGSRIGSDLFWWILAAMMLVMVSWLGWVMWQMMPKSIVTERALQTVIRPVPPVSVAEAPKPAISTADAQSTPADSNAKPVIAPSPVQTQSPSVDPKPSMPAASAPVVNAEKPSRQDIFKFATEISTPIPARRAKVTEGGGRAVAEVAKAPVAAAAGPVLPNAAKQAPPATQPSIAAMLPPAAREVARVADSTSSAAAAKPAMPASEPRIEKRDSAAVPQTAEMLYRRSVGLINQGRVSEGMDDLRNVIAADARHEAARQTLVALLLEQRRPDEAAGFLQQGLAQNPANTGFAMLLARIMVERQDVPGALTLLQQHAAAASNNAEYRAFTAALLQRLSRHKEAADEYAAALRISPQAGMWWVGLGISQEALEQRADALESFQRARQTRSLSTDVLAYVDQRVKQLQ